jgi:crotonobetainyl-CoA:carnitine CoA-transferase CaiB-like acyl-CoA transferase
VPHDDAAHQDPALAGTTVLELTSGIAGGYCGRLLAMLGADVIKVESRTRPDMARMSGPFPADNPHPDRSGLHRFLNAQKRSVSVDVRTATGYALLTRLAARADVLLDDGALGDPPDVVNRYDELLAQNDQLVVNAFSPYGLDGPKAAWSSAELVDLAASGWLQTAPVGMEPLMPGTPYAHHAAGTFGAIGVLLALAARTRIGTGQLVETRLNEALLSMLTAPTSIYVMAGLDGFRAGEEYPFAIYRCADGYLGVSILTQAHWIGLCALMERPDLRDHPRYRTGVERADPEAAAELKEIITAWIVDKPGVATFERGQAMRVPVAIVPAPSEVLASPQYAARDYWVESDDAELGHLRLPGNPFRYAEGGFAPFVPARSAGADSDAVLTSVGVPASARPALARAGVLW